MTRRGSILLVSSTSRYGVINRFSEELALGFRAHGYHTYLAQPHQVGAESLLKEAIASGPEFIFSFNAKALSLQIDGEPLHDYLRVPSLSFILDDPFEVQGLGDGAEALTLLVPDPRLAHLVQGSVKTLYHGGCGPIAAAPVNSRPIDLLFAASYHPPERIKEQWRELPSEMWAVMEEVTSLAKAGDERPLAELWAERRLGDSLQWLISERRALSLLEGYIRHERRARLLRHLTKAGLIATLVGVGWEAHPDAAAHHLLGSRSISETIDLYRRAKVALHLNPAYSSGSHERPLTAMLQGAALIAERSDFLSHHFVEGGELVTFKAADLALVPDLVSLFLTNTERCETIACAGQKAAARGHTWAVRANEILQIQLHSFHF